MLRNLFVFLIVVAVAVCATPTMAATVFYKMDTAGNNFTLSARTSAGDNFGLAAYSFELGGTIGSLTHMSPATPFGTGAGGAGPYGFNLLRTANTSLNYVAASQDTFGAEGLLIRGMGQEASSWALKGITPVGGDGPSPTWAVPLVIATGTFTGAAPTVVVGANTSAGTFSAATGVETSVATLMVDGGGGGIVPVITLNALGERELSAGIIDEAFMTSAGDLPITWSALSQSLGPNAAIPATIVNNRFNWNPAGSLAGKKGSGAVKYQWTATATNAAGMDTDIAIEVILIPEPATLSLFGLAMIALVGAFRRRG